MGWVYDLLFPRWREHEGLLDMRVEGEMRKDFLSASFGRGVVPYVPDTLKDALSKRGSWEYTTQKTMMPLRDGRLVEEVMGDPDMEDFFSLWFDEEARQLRYSTLYRRVFVTATMRWNGPGGGEGEWSNNVRSIIGILAIVKKLLESLDGGATEEMLVRNGLGRVLLVYSDEAACKWRFESDEGWREYNASDKSLFSDVLVRITNISIG